MVGRWHRLHAEERLELRLVLQYVRERPLGFFPREEQVAVMFGNVP